MRERITEQEEMFDMIALRELGDEHLMHRVMEANFEFHRTRIFSGGIKLNIPEVPAVRRIALVPWKEAVVVP